MCVCVSVCDSMVAKRAKRHRREIKDKEENEAIRKGATKKNVSRTKKKSKKKPKRRQEERENRSPTCKGGRSEGEND